MNIFIHKINRNYLSNAEDWAETVEDMDDFFEAFEGSSIQTTVTHIG